MQGIEAIYNIYSGCDYHRIVLPLTYLEIDIKKRGLSLEDLKDTRIITFNQSAPEIDKILEFKRQFNFKIVVDIDDYWELPVNHYLYNRWNPKDIIKCITKADVVTVTTKRLADKVIPFNKKIHVIPNALPFDEGQFTSTKNESEQIKFANIGGASHLKDISLLKYPIQKIAPEAIGKVTFYLCGYDDSNAPTEQLWTKIEGQFTGGGLLKKLDKNSIPLYARKPTLALSQYMNHYNDCDVLLVPLESNSFNQYKSNLKIIEAGSKNTAVITSNYPPYSDEPQKGLFRMCSNAKEWYDAIKFYMKNKNAAIEDGLKLGEYVRQHYDLKKINEYRRQLFESLQ